MASSASLAQRDASEALPPRRNWSEEAKRLGLEGWVRNRGDGTVEILAIGATDALGQLAQSCRQGPSAAQVTAVARGAAPDDGSRDFTQKPTSRGVAGAESAEI